MPWGNVYAGNPYASDSDFARALTAAAQTYAVAQRRRRHSPPSKGEPLTPEGPYAFTGPPKGYWLDPGSMYSQAPGIAFVPEVLAYLGSVNEAETKAVAAENKTSPATRRVLKERRASVKQERGLEELMGMRRDNTATLPTPWTDSSFQGGAALPQGSPGAIPKTPWQRFFTTLGDLFSGTGDESFANYERIMSNQ